MRSASRAAGLLERQAGDSVDDHDAPPAGAKVTDLAGDLQDLGGVRDAEVADADGLEGADLHPAVAAVAGRGRAVVWRASLPAGAMWPWCPFATAASMEVAREAEGGQK